MKSFANLSMQVQFAATCEQNISKQHEGPKRHQLLAAATGLLVGHENGEKR
jgi:hypothetical protein